MSNVVKHIEDLLAGVLLLCVPIVWVVKEAQHSHVICAHWHRCAFDMKMRCDVVGGEVESLDL